MKEAMRHVLQQSLVDLRMRDFESWVRLWQGQLVLVVMNIVFTETLEDIFQAEEHRRIKDVHAQVQFEIQLLTKAIRKKLTPNQRTTISSLLTNRVHARELLATMRNSDFTYCSDFLWVMHMKYNY